MSSYKIGQVSTLTRTFTIDDVIAFANVTGDQNPIHLDEEYAKKTIYGKRIVHGMLVSSLFSNLIASELPGEGTIYLGQTLNFQAPVYIGDKLSVKIEVVALKIEKKIMTLKTEVKNEGSTLVLVGEAVVKFK